MRSKRTPRKRRTWILAAALLAASLCFGLWLAWPRERLLLTAAQPIAALDATRSFPVLGEARERAFWLSNTQLLILTTEQWGGFVYDPAPTWRGHAEVFDTVTRERRRLKGLTDALNRVGFTPRAVDLSPGKRWIHWTAWRDTWDDGKEILHYIGPLDGGAPRKWRSSPRALDSWLDDRRYVETGWEGAGPPGITVRDAQTPKADRHYAQSSPEAEAILRQLKPAAVVKAPEGTPETDPVFSPQRSEIAYTLSTEQASPLLVFGHRLLRWIPAPIVYTETLWVSRSDGTGLREIGHVSGEHIPRIDAVQWLPDGRQISFIYRGTLYVVPVAPQG